MVSVWVTNGDSIIADGAVNLNSGRTVTLSDIPGKVGKISWLTKLAAAAQDVIDDIQPVADIPVDDLDKGASSAELLARYGNRRFFDGRGNIVSRSTEISFSFIDGILVPTTRWVR